MLETDVKETNGPRLEIILLGPAKTMIGRASQKKDPNVIDFNSPFVPPGVGPAYDLDD